MTFAQKLFGFHGRLRRRDFWLLNIALSILAIALMFGVNAMFGVALTDPRLSLLNFITLWPGLAVMAKRLHDRNRSGWLAIIGWLPSFTPLLLMPFSDARLQVVDQVLSMAIGLWMLIDLGILDGTKGPNRYGASPKGLGAPTDAQLDEVFG